MENIIREVEKAIKILDRISETQNENFEVTADLQGYTFTKIVDREEYMELAINAVAENLSKHVLDQLNILNNEN